MNLPTIDYSDIQGLVRFGHSHLKAASFLLLKIENPGTARRWLATASVTTAEKLTPPPTTALQVAFTYQGLQALGVPENIIKGFSPEFIAGMTGDENRSRRLGDTGANDPSRWQWGRPGNIPDALLMLYAEQDRLKDWKRTLSAEWLNAVFQVLTFLDSEDLDGREPFGFKDGISQPKIDWDREQKVGSGNQLEYSNLLALGEFLLGYPNEYGKYTDRPLVDPRYDPSGELVEAEDQTDKKDLGRNGTYLVFRQLRQDVRGFWQFLDKQASSNEEERLRLAESMVGRTIDGKPLVPSIDRRIQGVGPEPEDTSLNQFTFASDNTGTRCPFGAHIRRANPRNADLPEGTAGFFARLTRILGFGGKSIRDDLIASSRYHRILRRGRDYGHGLSLKDALDPGQPEDEERGLHFICINANIARQFEFVQNAWIMSTKFDGLTQESDPLLGNRESVTGRSLADAFSLPQETGVRRRITGLPQFVVMRGGAYFFLPGIRALRYLAKVGS